MGLREENKRLREQLAAIDAGDLAKAFLVSAGPDLYKGGYEFVIRSPVGAMLAEFGYGVLSIDEPENYVELGVVCRDRGPLIITFQRTRGETPGQRATRLEAELAKLRASAPGEKLESEG